MVKVPSSLGKGKTVDVEIKGVAEAIAYIRRKGKEIKDGTDSAMFQAANFVQGEVQESIIGNRAEPRSVRTGRLANSITLDKIKHAEYIIFPEKEFYPGGKVDTQKVATWLEYGTTKIKARRHFTNTKNRTKHKVIQILSNQIKKI